MASIARLLRSRRVWLVSSSALALLVGAGTMALASRDSADMIASAHARREAFEGRKAAVLLHRVGISPESMAAAGLNSIESRAVLVAALAYQFGPDIDALTLQQNQLRQKAVKPRSGPRPDNELSVEQAELALKQRLDHAFEFVTAGLLQSQKTTLSRIRANSSWGLPTKYLVVERTSKEWLKLRGALSRKRASAKMGSELPTEVASFISTADSDTAVQAASVRLSSLLNSTKELWDDQLDLRPDRGQP